MPVDTRSVRARAAFEAVQVAEPAEGCLMVGASGARGLELVVAPGEQGMQRNVRRPCSDDHDTPVALVQLAWPLR